MFFIENNKTKRLVFGNVLKIIRDLLTYPHLARRKRNLFFFKSGSIVANPHQFFAEFSKDDYYRENTPLAMFMIELSELYGKSKIEKAKRNKLLFDFFTSMLKWIDANNPQIKPQFIANFFRANITKFQPVEFANYVVAHKTQFIEPIDLSNPLYRLLVSGVDFAYLREFLAKLGEPKKLKKIYSALIEVCLNSKFSSATEKMDILKTIFNANPNIFAKSIELLPEEYEHKKAIAKLMAVGFDHKYKHVFDFLNIKYVYEYADGQTMSAFGAADCSVEGISVALAALSSKKYFAYEPPVIIAMGDDNSKAHNLFYFFEAIHDNKKILNGVDIPFICESYHWFAGVVSIEDDNIKVVLVDSRDFVSHFIVDYDKNKRFLFDLMQYLRYCLNIEFYIHSTEAQSDSINCAKFALFNLRELARYIEEDKVADLYTTETPLKFFLPAQSMRRVNGLIRLPEANSPIKKNAMTFRAHFTPAFKVAGIRAARQKDRETKKEINTTILSKSTGMMNRVLDYLDNISDEQLEVAIARHSLGCFLDSIDSGYFISENYGMEEYIGSVMDDFVEDLATRSQTIPENWYAVMHGAPLLTVQENPAAPVDKRLRLTPSL